MKLEYFNLELKIFLKKEEFHTVPETIYFMFLQHIFEIIFTNLNTTFPCKNLLTLQTVSVHHYRSLLSLRHFFFIAKCTHLDDPITYFIHFDKFIPGTEF